MDHQRREEVDHQWTVGCFNHDMLSTSHKLTDVSLIASQISELSWDYLSSGIYTEILQLHDRLQD